MELPVLDQENQFTVFFSDLMLYQRTCISISADHGINESQTKKYNSCYIHSLKKKDQTLARNVDHFHLEITQQTLDNIGLYSIKENGKE